jgi:hypothetical protein
MATEVQARAQEAEPAVPVDAGLEQKTAVMPVPAKVKEPKKDAKSAKKSKASKDKKGKGEPPVSDGPSVAGHPRAAHQVALAKAWGGLIGFMLGGYFSLPTHTFTETGLRALGAGIVCYLVAWAGAVFLWRHLVVLEIKDRERELLMAAHPGHADPAALAVGESPVGYARARTAP